MSENTTMPKIFLAIDNSFAIKRWTKPSEWMRIIRDLGVNYVEASTDNECDPIFSDKNYLADWLQEVKSLQSEWGMKIVNFHTGYQTYRTIGLAHDDKRMREKAVKDWFIPLIDMAMQLEAGVGFSFFAMTENDLQSASAYAMTEKNILASMHNILAYAGPKKVAIIIEQMYSPMQPPWTISGTRSMMELLHQASGFTPHITLDLGHQSGQKKFIRKTKEQLIEAIETGRKQKGKGFENIWLGPQIADGLFEEALTNNAPSSSYANKISDEMERYPFLFANKEDGDTYLWLEEIGCFSPIIHMQQSDGHFSKHLPFTEANNNQGIIDGGKVLQSLHKSYKKNEDSGKLSKAGEIYLTLEILYSQHDLSKKILKEMKESVDYWRKFIPQDGIRLDELVRNVG